VEVLRLHSAIRRHAERRQYAKAIAAFQPRAIALADKVRGELIAQRRAAGIEPVIGEGERGGNISRPEIADAIGAGLQGVAPAAAERVR
jgi:hypothetical protein